MFMKLLLQKTRCNRPNVAAVNKETIKKLKELAHIIYNDELEAYDKCKL